MIFAHWFYTGTRTTQEEG